MKVRVRCPRTDKVLQISISDDDKTLAARWDKHVRYSCMHCGGMHTIKYRSAWASGILDDLAPNALATSYLRHAPAFPQGLRNKH
jgi:hypothetical protein